MKIIEPVVIEFAGPEYNAEILRMAKNTLKFAKKEFKKSKYKPYKKQANKASKFIDSILGNKKATSASIRGSVEKLVGMLPDKIGEIVYGSYLRQIYFLHCQIKNKKEEEKILKELDQREPDIIDGKVHLYQDLYEREDYKYIKKGLYSHEIYGYPYKSTNIVDLATEIEEVYHRVVCEGCMTFDDVERVRYHSELEKYAEKQREKMGQPVDKQKNIVDLLAEVEKVHKERFARGLSR